MENKELYYTPNLEDIRIGYICETIIEGEDPIEYTFKKEDLFTKPNVCEDHKLVKVKKASFRTKYLTKEDIESCGWVYDLHKGWCKKDWRLFQLNIIKDNVDIRMIGISYDGVQIFSGECKSINELIYISKLLNIK